MFINNLMFFLIVFYVYEFFKLKKFINHFLCCFIVVFCSL